MSADGPRGPGAQKAAPRRPLAFLIHSLLGLKLSLFTLFVCATGTLAMVSDELEWLYRPELRASATDRTVTWGARYAAARAAYPTYTIDYAAAGEAPFLATRFFATSPAGETRIVYVDPATGRVTGESGWITLPSILRALHSYLFVPGDWGFYAVTALGTVLMVALVTGLLTYKKFWRGLFRMPRRQRGARVLWGDLHRLVGLWSSWFVFVIAFTSLWYLGERVLYRAGIDFETPRSVIDDAALDALGPAPPVRQPLDALIAVATARLPTLEVREIWFPARPREPLFLRGQATAWLVRNRTNGVELNPYTGEVLAVHRAEDMPLAERWTHTADPLHFGDFAGLGSKLVWTFFGLAMCFSAASGAVIHAKRLAQAARNHPFRFAAESGYSLRRLDFLGRWKWPNLLMITLVPAAAYAFDWALGFAPQPASSLTLGPSPIGPWDAVARTGAVWPTPAGSEIEWNVRFCDGSYAEIRFAALGLGGPGEPPADLSPLSGGANTAAASAVVPEHRSGTPLYLWLQVVGWDGRRYTVAWPLPP